MRSHRLWIKGKCLKPTPEAPGPQKTHSRPVKGFPFNAVNQAMQKNFGWRPLGTTGGSRGIGPTELSDRCLAGLRHKASTRATISCANSTKACAPLDAGSNTTPGRP